MYQTIPACTTNQSECHGSLVREIDWLARHIAPHPPVFRHAVSIACFNMQACVVNILSYHISQQRAQARPSLTLSAKGAHEALLKKRFLYDSHKTEYVYKKGMIRRFWDVE